MWAGNLVRARLLARKGIVDPTDFTSLLAWRLESDVSDVPDVPDVPAELLSWEGVAYHINKGTYKDVYSIGDMVPLDLGSEGIINMQVAAFDAEPLADGSGTAAITWVAKELLATKKRMNPAKVDGSDGTGSFGGWAVCEMRSYLKNDIKSLISADVMGMIESVNKTQHNYHSSSPTSKRTQTTTDDLWIPTIDENLRGAEIKYLAGSTTSSGWWGRNAASGGAKWWGVTTAGKELAFSADSTHGICLGFCTGRTPT